MTEANYQTATASLIGPDKSRNGDCSRSELIGDGRYLAVMLADGVGSTSLDWKASETACRQFIDHCEKHVQEGEPVEEWLPEVIGAVDGEMHQEGGLLCAAIALVWEVDTEHVYYVNVGDTRLYACGVTGLEQVSEDDSQAVVRRGSDGRPLIVGGTVVVQRGISSAMGNGRVKPKVGRYQLADGESLVLASDGFYTLSESFSKEMLKAISHSSLELGLDLLSQNYTSGNTDDATVFALRRNYPRLSQKELEEAVAGRPGEELPRHAVVLEIYERLPELVESNANEVFRAYLNYVWELGVVFETTYINRLMKQMGQAGWNLRNDYEVLLKMITAQQNF